MAITRGAYRPAARVGLGFMAALLWMGLLGMLDAPRAGAKTPAGTVITNCARASFDTGSVASAPVTAVVAQLAGFAVTAPQRASSGPSDETRCYPVTIANGGTGDDTASLSWVSSRGWPTAVYLDDNADGVHQSAETTLLASTGDLSAGAQVACVLAVTVPAGAAEGDAEVLTVTSGVDPSCVTTVSFATDLLSPSAPVADFSASPTTGPLPLAATFTDQSTGSPTAWEWDFGDGTSSTGESPAHTYTRGGGYTVSLVVTNAAGEASCTKTRYILADFPDVAADFWAHGQVMDCLQEGLVAGYPDGLYHPEGVLSRDQMAVFLARGLAGGDASVPTAPAEAAFPDVSPSQWAFRYVTYAVAQHIVQGYPDGTFQPALPVDRAQMAVFLARALVTPHGEGGLAGYAAPAAPAFQDISSDFWAYRYIAYVASQGVVEGYPDGTYRPVQLVTRDQMAVYLARAFALGEKQSSGAPHQQ